MARGLSVGLFERFRSDRRDGARKESVEEDAAEQEALDLINEGNAIEDDGRVDEALQRYEAAIRLAPNLARAHLNLGNVRILQGDLPGAVNAFTEALRLNPDYAAAHYNVGNVHLRSGHREAALAAYHKAILSKPDFADAEVASGAVLEELGRHQEAVASYRRALAIAPALADVHCKLGNVLRELGQLESAVTSYRRALEINPDFVEAHSNLGTALKDLGQFEGAVASFRRALEIKPALAELHYNLGKVLRDHGQFDEAVASYRRALEIKPDLAVAHYNLANTLRDLRRPRDAVESYRRALQVSDSYPDANTNLGNALLDLGEMDDAAASYRQALEINPASPIAASNLLFCLSHMESISPDALFEEHCRFGAQFEGPLRGNWPQHNNTRDPDRRLHVGFVSGDLHDHAVAYFIEPVLACLAGSASLTLHAYYNHPVEDAVSKRMRGFFSHWHPIASLSDAALAQQIGHDGIDILIDLSGHTGETRLLTFARKPAPIQASWIGYPGTTGLSAMDYYLADRQFLPAGFERQFTEKLVYLPAVVPFLPNPISPPVNRLPALNHGYLTFGSFNRLSKVSDTAVDLWSRLLLALPDTRMIIGGMPEESKVNPLTPAFEARGIASARLHFHPRCSAADYLALHHRVDVCLDTYPYTGGTTTSHALWMGVPTLSLAGPTPAGRQGAAILGLVGLDEFVVADAAEFTRKGVQLAGNLDSLARVRAELRQRFQRSPLADARTIASGLERAFRIMWQRWCAGKPPQSQDVSVQANKDAPAGT